jgi:hypothetical protein
MTVIKAIVYDQDDNKLMDLQIGPGDVPRKGDHLSLTCERNMRYVEVKEVWWCYSWKGELALLNIRATDTSLNEPVEKETGE